MAAQQGHSFIREQDKPENLNEQEQQQQHENAPAEERQETDRNARNVNRTDKRGFASMDTNLQRQIASKGGRAAHQQGVAHEFNSAEAREAGRKGGVAVSRNRQHMAEIGRKGGEAAHKRKKQDASV